jgi:hypothetical protein
MVYRRESGEIQKRSHTTHLDVSFLPMGAMATLSPMKTDPDMCPKERKVPGSKIAFLASIHRRRVLIRIFITSPNEKIMRQRQERRGSGDGEKHNVVRSERNERIRRTAE